MKKYLVPLVFLFSIFIVHMAMGQSTASVSTSPVSAAVVQAATTPPLSVWGWVKAHWPTVCFFLYWLLDVIIYFLPTKATGILVQIESWLKSQASPPTIS